MSKALGFIIFIFFVLVGINLFASIIPSLLPPLPSSLTAAAQNVPVGVTNYTSDGLPSINVNFFSPSGIGKNYITQGYGHTPYAYLYINGWHNGIDIAASFGTPVYSLATGTVLATVNQDAYCPHIAFGKYAAIDDTTHQLVFVFSHLGNFAVTPGETIGKGTFIGDVGPTGLETGPHLLVSIFEQDGFSTTTAHGCGPYPQGHDVDPLNYLGSVYN